MIVNKYIILDSKIVDPKLESFNNLKEFENCMYLVQIKINIFMLISTKS